MIGEIIQILDILAGILILLVLGAFYKFILKL